MMNRFMRFFFCAFFFFTAWFCFAREIILYVEDADLTIPLEGAVVHTWDKREIVCDQNGEVMLDVPDSRPASVQISYPGYRTERFTITAASVQSRYTIALHIEGLLESKELIFTAEKISEGAEVQSGRSVSIAGKELARTSEIGFIEDVMTSVKLLPGVGYTGMFNAMPSIRGGDPDDLVAVLDGFYIENPYFWGGGMSIFDPRMIQSVKLSHGIFSSRFGYTISGLLELSSKKPSPVEKELELGVSTSAANLNVSLPFNDKGGIMIMGRVTYWDGFVALVKLMSNFITELEDIKAVTTAPYIRTAAFSGNYQLTSNTEFTFNGFIGADGVGASYANLIEIDDRKQEINMTFDWDNLKWFLISGLITNPSPSMVLKASLGAGFAKTYLNGDIYNNLYLKTSADAKSRLEALGVPSAMIPDDYILNQHLLVKINNTTWTAQGRVDYDHELGKGFLFAAGVQEFYNQWRRYLYFQGPSDIYGPYPPFIGPVPPPPTPVPSPPPPNAGYMDIDIRMPAIEGYNHVLTSSAYTLLEYKTPGKKFAAELGLRADHLYFMGDGFTIQTYPSLNPRLNLDFNLLKNHGLIDSLAITLGTGLFSSLTEDITALQSSDGIEDFELKQNRSWTSLAGIKFQLFETWMFNLEAYFKYVFDREYTLVSTTQGGGQDPVQKTDYRFDGDGQVWGFDFMLQKLESKYVDGWISYTFNFARYKNPLWVNSEGQIVEGDWRYPSYHRFHNLNIVLNIKPSKRYNIATRLGFASGTPLSDAGEIIPYPVLVVRNGAQPFFIEKFKRSSVYSDTKRDGFVLPLDVKCSFYFFNPEGKTQGEMYIAAENLLSFLKTKVQNTSFNEYTGTEVEGSDTASYQMPIPMVSFGFTWSY